MQNDFIDGNGIGLESGLNKIKEVISNIFFSSRQRIIHSYVTKGILNM